MNPTTQALSSALANARSRAQRERHEVICLIAGENAVTSLPYQSDHGQRDHGRHEAQGIRAIVRPDEPILFCGLFPT